MALHQYQKDMYKKIGIIAALVILPIAGFFVGMQYQKQTTAADPNPNRTGKFANGPRGGMLRDRAIGTVKAISGSSITVTSRFDNSDKTYTITSSTTYKNGTSDATAADVKVGDSVMLTLDSSDNTKVTTVTLNPVTMFRGTDDGNGPSSDAGAGNVMLQ